MQAGNTLQVRKAINAAIKEVGASKIGTWTDPKNWSNYDTKVRVVAYLTTDIRKVVELATEKLLNAGFNNKIRITDVSDSCYSNGPYIRVVAELP